jgi:hypothetical protein
MRSKSLLPTGSNPIFPFLGSEHVAVWVESYTKFLKNVSAMLKSKFEKNSPSCFATQGTTHEQYNNQFNNIGYV